MVSVILPTYNRAQTLAQSVSSVLSQTFTNFELIIVDDGSGDSTPEVVGSFRDPRIRYIRYPENRGAAHARNVGLAESRGELVAFQDSDDVWMPQKLEKQVAALGGARKGTALVYSDMLRMEEDGTLAYFAAPEVRKGVLADPVTNDYQVFMLGLVTVLAAKRCLEEVGGFDESLTRYIDLDILARLALRYEFFHLKEPLAIYRCTKGISADPYNSYISRSILLRKFNSASLCDRPFISRQYHYMGLDLISIGDYRKGVSCLLKAYRTYPGVIRHDINRLKGHLKVLFTPNKDGKRPS